MPEKGALAICGYIVEDGMSNPKPMCLAFIPVALQAALESNVIKLEPDVLTDNPAKNLVFSHFRKLQDGAKTCPILCFIT